ncbi:MAG TPA: DUF1269 domain-containing protein [Candidatus Nanoarchaeia archaeon]|nr:DUF1269 domain-containing protein [Candidatus Nanoarchaeia archaeon]
MERMLVIVFENELKAYDGSRELKALDAEGSISIHSEAIITKNDDGTTTIKQEGDDFPIRTVGGTAVGALIGLLGGPVGLAAGALAGTFAGAVWDMDRAGVNADFLNEVSAKLTAGKWAVVSDVSEEWVTPVDTRMGALGGTVFRTTRSDVEHQQDARDIAAIKADIAQLKAEQAKSRADQKAKLQNKIDNLNKKLQTKLEQAKQRSQNREEEAKAKVDALEKKAAKAKGEAKVAIEARIAEIKKKSTESKERTKQLLEDEPF